MSKIRVSVSNGCWILCCLIPWWHRHVPGPEAPDPATRVRCDDGSVQEFMADHLRLAGFRDPVPRRQVRVGRGQEHHCGSCAPAALLRPQGLAAGPACPAPGDG